MVRYQKRFFQLEPQSRDYAPAQGQVLVCEGRHGGLAIEYRGRALRWREIVAAVKPSMSRPVIERAAVPSPVITKRKWVPPADHPWREAARRGRDRAERRAAAPPLALPSASP